MLCSLWFEFGVSLKGKKFERDPEFECIDMRCQVNSLLLRERST